MAQGGGVGARTAGYTAAVPQDTPQDEAAPAPDQAPPAPLPCPNCGAGGVGRFCPSCGQPGEDRLRQPVRRLAADLLEETISLDSRLARTLGPLLLHPGAVTADHLAGRRARYTSPLRLYLVASLLFFGLTALRGGPTVQVDLRPSGAGAWDGPAVASARPDLAEAEAGLRAGGGLLRTALADRLAAARALPPGEAERRLGAELALALPRAAFLLVPAFAALLTAAFARRGRYYAEHLVVALHLHAAGFLLLAPAALAGRDAVTAAAMGAVTLHSLLALRRAYGLGWLAAGWRFALLATGYLVALGLALAAAGLSALWLFPAAAP